MKRQQGRRRHRESRSSALQARAPGSTQVVASEGDEPSPDTLAGHHAVYDTGLVQALREHWRLGDWTALAAVAAGDIEHHPDRARLALLVAAGHLGIGNHSGVSAFSSLALRWGSDRASLARVLLSGVHNTLGRASALSGDSARSVERHFEQAVSLCGARPASPALLQQRQKSQLPASQPLPASAAPGSPGTAELARQMSHWQDETNAAFRRLEKALERAVSLLGESLHAECSNVIRQVESQITLQGFLAGGALMPELRDWPVSPDLAVLLLRLLMQGDYDAVVEFGSGSSTQLMARVLQRLGPRPAGRRPCRIVAFEHLEKYRHKTQGQLQQAGVQAMADVVLAPLVPLRLPDGREVPYYDCARPLHALAEKLCDDRPQRVLSLVDGPPGLTAPLARHPALAVLRRHFPAAQLDLLLDDYRRPDEQETARRWQAELQSERCAFSFEEFALDKGACLLSVRP